jgi:HSP20 family molecular chaperone IbpA
MLTSSFVAPGTSATMSSSSLFSFSVPQGIDASKIDAQLSAGVLRLRLPKSDAVKPRRIEVKAG